MADRLILTAAFIAAAVVWVERRTRPVDHRHPTTPPRSAP